MKAYMSKNILPVESHKKPFVHSWRKKNHRVISKRSQDSVEIKNYSASPQIQTHTSVPFGTIIPYHSHSADLSTIRAIVVHHNIRKIQIMNEIKTYHPEIYPPMESNKIPFVHSWRKKNHRVISKRSQDSVEIKNYSASPQIQTHTSVPFGTIIPYHSQSADLSTIRAIVVHHNIRKIQIMNEIKTYHPEIYPPMESNKIPFVHSWRKKIHRVISNHVQDSNGIKVTPFATIIRTYPIRAIVVHHNIRKNSNHE